MQHFIIYKLSKLRRTIGILMLVFLCNFVIHAQTPVTIDILDAYGTDQVLVPVLAYDFNDIVAMQFTISFDNTKLQMDEIIEGDVMMTTPNNFNIIQDLGKTTFSWIDPTLLGVNAPDGNILFTLVFTVLELGVSTVTISDTPTMIEIVDVNDDLLDLIVDEGTINGVGGKLSGFIFNDQDGNCLPSSGDGSLGGWTIEMTSADNDYTIFAENDGTYNRVVDTGTYEVTLVTPNDLWEPCGSSVTIDINIDDELTQDFGADAIIDCPMMQVEIAAPLIRRCFSNNYYLNYCNMGTVDAVDAYIIVELEDYIDINSTSVPSYDAGGNNLGFELGTVAVGECGQILINFTPNCDETMIGQTVCTTAEIFPNDFCNTSMGWSGASVALSAECDGDNINFTIANVGDSNMDESLEYIVIEDAVMLQDGTPFNLGTGETLPFQLPANGSTYRLEAMQVANHPGNSMPSVTVEGCGENGAGFFSTGFVTQFPADEADEFIAIDCQELIGSFDPNDKAAFPKGKTDAHLIDRNIDIDYKIRFQNTGTDTAFTVVILDSLSAQLDPTTLRQGPSSHDYELTILEGNILQFTFNNIMLPDSNVNVVGSNGFVQFKISQQPDLDYGTMIYNNAAIYFDFNEPVITNTTFHEVGVLPVNTSEVHVPGLEVEVYPNPTNGYAIFSLSGSDFKEVNFTLFNLQGQVVKEAVYAGNTFKANVHQLIDGAYFYKISHEGLDLASGKLMVRK